MKEMKIDLHMHSLYSVDGELSPEGIATRDGGKNEGTKANN